MASTRMPLCGLVANTVHGHTRILGEPGTTFVLGSGGGGRRRRVTPTLRGFTTTTRQSSMQKLEEIGQFTPMWKRPYYPGQFFIHSKLGYRGIVVFPWKTDLHVNTINAEKAKHQLSYDLLSRMSKKRVAAAAIVKTERDDTIPNRREDDMLAKRDVSETVSKEHQFYQVLVSERDISSQQRSLSALIPCIGSENSRQSDAFDFVDHDHILPFNPSNTVGSDETESEARFDNKLFAELFQTVEFDNHSHYVTGTLAVPKIRLTHWFHTASQQLRYSSVYKSSSNGINITVVPFFVGVVGKNEEERGGGKGDRKEVEDDSTHYKWAYTVTIENTTKRHLQLVSRLWFTAEADEEPNIDKGRGVVGLFPYLSPDEPMFVYSSTTTIKGARGMAWGHFTLVEVNGGSQRSDPFEVRVPKFYFDYSDDDNTETSFKAIDTPPTSTTTPC